MKRRITLRGWNWSGRITTSVLGLTLFLLGFSRLDAQQPAPTGVTPTPLNPHLQLPPARPGGIRNMAQLPLPPVTTKKIVPGQPPSPNIVPRIVPPAAPVLPRTPAQPRTSKEQQSTVRPAMMQVPARSPTAARDGEYALSFKLPGPEELFRLQSDAALFERMRQQARSAPKKLRLEFPADPVVSTEVYYGRAFPPIQEIAEPNYVCHRRTYFDQKNFARYGWDLGIITPFVCAGKFYADVFFLPYHLGTEPWRHYECNTGYCLPGDPVPLYLYPPRLSLTGAAAQAGALSGAFFVFP